MEQTSTKSILLYNARDLHQTFVRLYREVFGQEYKVKSFIGYEMKGLKQLQEKYDVWSILCAIKTCIKAHNSSVTVHYLISSPKEYVPDANAELRWMIGEYGSSELKQKLTELLLLGSQWFPSASQNRRQKDLLKELQEWVNEKETQEGWINKT